MMHSPSPDVPAWPSVPSAQQGRGALPLRYEDVTQDGRVSPRAITHALGAALWNDALGRHPLVEALEPEGILPILTRLMVRAGGGPVAASATLACEGRFALTQVRAPDGDARYRLDLWARVEGLRGRTWGPPPEGTGECILLGEVYGEHTLTRPFAPPEGRVVRALPAEAHEAIAVLSGRSTAPSSAADLPAGATLLDDAWVRDAAPVAFGLGHTDSNHHVNSLVYPLLLEEAALRCLAARGLPTGRFAHAFDLAFRKPFLAGQGAQVLVRAYQRGAAVGVLGLFVPLGAGEAGDPIARAHCHGRIELIP